jgi:cyclase
MLLAAVASLPADARQQARPAAPAAAPAADDIKVFPVRGTISMLVGQGNNVTVQIEPPTRPARVPGTYLGGYGVLLVDTSAPGQGDKVRAAVRRLSPSPIRYILNTHIHPEAMGSNEVLSAGPVGRGGAPAVTILSHENMLLQLASPPAGTPETPQGALPTDAYVDTKELFFNGESIQVFHMPNAHTDGDSIVYFRRSDVISAGDIFVTTTYPVIDSARGGSLKGIIEGLNKILDLAIPESNEEGGTLIIPGSGRLSDEADVVEYRNMNVVIYERIQDMVRKGMTLEQVKAARPTLDYDFRYGKSAAWTTDMFVKAVFDEISKTVTPARPAGRGRGRSQS